ncbi:hypothetical protein MTO96_015934 [Rhipicephalus appendiculatus]
MHDIGRVYRFQDHPLAGVNWRPTRFVDEVHASCLCGICRMIPREIVLLPCLHALCESCHTANSGSDGARCPFDQAPFDEAECVRYDLPTGKADTMKVYCWNEAHGCHFEGPMEGMLRHYEKECTFHTSECARCGEGVLHRDLKMHYLAGCGVAVSPARTENVTSKSEALTLPDLGVALEEVETPFRDNKHLGNQGSTLAATPSDVEESKEAATGVAAAATSTWSTDPTPRQSHTETASGSPSSWIWLEDEMEKAEKLNFFAHMPAVAVYDLNKIDWRSLPAHFVAPCGPKSADCRLGLVCDPLEAKPAWSKLQTSGRYVLFLDNIREHQPSPWEACTKLCKISVMHSPDSYFNLDVSRVVNFIYLRIQCYSMIHWLPRAAPSFHIVFYDRKRRQELSLESVDGPCYCKHDVYSTEHYHLKVRDVGGVYRFQDHPIVGVNWRSTRFVDEVPKSRLCGLCRMIPREIVLLPCLHALCQSCHTANSRSDGARCPFDQAPFDEAECVRYDLPTGKADTMKVHCWNEAHGCHFEGPMEGMLRHYEKECTFHTSECARCGEGVLHRDLKMHYLAGCGVAVSPARTENVTSKSEALTLPDLGVALEEVETPFRENDKPAVESKTNTPAEHFGNQGSTLAATPIDAEETNEAATGVAAAASSTWSTEPTPRQSHTETASESSSSRTWLEEMLKKAEKLKFFTHMPAVAVYDLNKINWQCLPAHFIAPCGPKSADCRFGLACDPLEAKPAWSELRTSGRYVLVLDNIREHQPSHWEECKKRCMVSVIHSPDSYFNLEVSQDVNYIYLRIQCYSIIHWFQRSAPSFNIMFYDRKRRQEFSVESVDDPCHCKHDIYSTEHHHLKVRARHDILKGGHLSGSLLFFIHYR